MLSRIAESLFWIGRLVERAEDVARMLDVSVNLLLEESSASDVEACRTLLSVVGVSDDARGRCLRRRPRPRPACLRPGQPDLEFATRRPRERTHGARGHLLRDVALPQHDVQRPARRSGRGPSAVARRLYFNFVKERAALVSGLVDGTMSHDDGWRFLVLGRSVERADMTVRALSLYQVVGDPATSAGALLRSCGAYESFLRTYRGSLDPRHATEFLLLDRLFPRSVYAAIAPAPSSVCSS